MRKMQEQILANIAGVEDGLEQVARGIMAFLSFFAEHPEYVELLIQERAQFKDRKRPTYFEHREVNVERWRKLYARLIAEGRVRDIPVERITDVVGNLIYGTMFTNYFTGQAKPVEQQAQEILDIVFRGILTDRGASAARGREGRERRSSSLWPQHRRICSWPLNSLEARTPMDRRLCAGLLLLAGMAGGGRLRAGQLADRSAADGQRAAGRLRHCRSRRS